MPASKASEPDRVLVTGGAGFIGTNFVRAALAAGHAVTVLDNLSQNGGEHIEGLPIRLIRGDILDRDLVAREVEDHGSVVHLAAQTGVPGSIDDPRRDCEVNVIGTLNVLEACRQASGQPRRLVVASSNAPLGNQLPPAAEDKAPLPVSPYGASKLAAEGYCLAYHGSWGVRTVALRFSNVYGPYSGHKGSVVAKFFSEIAKGAPIKIDGGGEQTRDFIYVGDLCAAILAVIRSDVAGEIFQIGTGQATSIGHLVELIEEVSGIRSKRLSSPLRRGDIRDNYSRIEKANRMLGWKPVTELREGLARTWEWFTEHGPHSA